MSSINKTFAGFRKHIQLIFWRLMAFLIDSAVRHRKSLLKLLPFIPLLWYGSAAYVAGLIIGELIKVIFL
jgi:hypothetical protein